MTVGHFKTQMSASGAINVHLLLKGDKANVPGSPKRRPFRLFSPPGTLYQAPPFVMPSLKLESSSFLRQGGRWLSDMTGLYME